MARTKRKYDDDDGRVISPMNVEGMPGYHPEQERTPKRPDGQEPVKLSFGETMSMIGGMLKAALLVGLCFFALFALVILFIQFVLT